MRQPALVIAPDPHVPGYFDEWYRMRLARYGVGWKSYRETRLGGTWNEAAEVLFPGRDEFKVEGERRNG